MKANDHTNQAANGHNLKTQSVEEWWAKISPGQKALSQHIGLMMGEVTEVK